MLTSSATGRCRPTTTTGPVACQHRQQVPGSRRLRRTETSPSRGASCSSAIEAGSLSTFWCIMVSAHAGLSRLRRDDAAGSAGPRRDAAYLDDDFGNAGSRTHEWGRRARTAVEHARDSRRRGGRELPRRCDLHQRRDGKQQPGDSRAGRRRRRPAAHRLDGDRAPRRARTARGAGAARLRRHAGRSRPGRRRRPPTPSWPRFAPTRCSSA